ncbi:replication endonuclease [Aestuariibacter sp. A3R04]|uniref:replication endonuclease n=1 Tax=Aestuariibacter sp. A3R04 TaxID=2841571 RepID=UPI001C08F3B3|nr:replication endonuclease [Aestuariibacter sp. A3R04]MBU3022868.1 replication endonuclease [Aestuariibacter sp. A3R04]
MRHEVKKRRRLLQWHTATITDFAKNVKSARQFINGRLEGIPYPIGRTLIDEYSKKYRSETALNPTRAANIFIRKATDSVRRYLDTCCFDDLRALHNDKVLGELAISAANTCKSKLNDFVDQESTQDYEQNMKRAFDLISDFVSSWGLSVPLRDAETETDAQAAAIMRMTDPEWWERRLLRMREQINEHVAVLIGLVRKNRQIYASNRTVQNWRNQQRKNADYLEQMELVDEDTEERYSLKDIVNATSSAPEKRRIELMIRCRGLEDLADDFGYVSYFVTWTAPSKYHPNSKKYNGSTAKQTQSYLVEQWAKCRAAIKRAGIEWFGVRVAEPHADSCPHWHMLVFVSPQQKSNMQKIMANYACEHEQGELINKKGVINIKPRFDIQEIDRSKGSATGYIAKYISKNVDGAGLQNQPDFETGNTSIDEGIERVTAWANCWKIRQFQFFGAAPVTVWRELRRLKIEFENDVFEKIRRAADSAKWAEFTKLLKENPVRLRYGSVKNELGEKIRKIAGLVFQGFNIETRVNRYRLERRKAQLKNRDSGFTWSTVTNCTGDDDRLSRAVTNSGLSEYFVPIIARGHKVTAGNRVFEFKENTLFVRGLE